jgi:hypothetical protein
VGVRGEGWVGKDGGEGSLKEFAVGVRK